MSARTPLTIPVLLSSAAVAAPAIDPQFSSAAVIQRGKPIALSGTAAPLEAVSVNFAGKTRFAVADKLGKWRVEFAAMPAGGPYVIQVRAADGETCADDVMVGDVWLCSGQSNMEYPLRRALNGDAEVQSAADDELRLMKVQQQLADSPRTTFAKPPLWRRSAPDSARDFSAACFFMARALRKSEKVPIGAIDDSWGGTPIRAWMSEDAARSSGNGEAAELLDLYRKDRTSGILRFGALWGAWWRSKTGDAIGKEPWRAPDRLTWSPVPALTYWDKWAPAWKSWIGSLWVRDRFSLTSREANQPAIQSLSAIDDMDQTFINGVPVGARTILPTRAVISYQGVYFGPAPTRS